MPNRLLALVSGAGLGLVIVTSSILARIVIDESSDHDMETHGRSAMDIAAAFACHPAETRHVIIGGKEDGFLPSQDETTSLSDRLRNEQMLSRALHSRYDQDRPNYMFADHFVTPRPATGLFVIRMRAIADNGNDGIFIGDLTEVNSISPDAERLFFSSLLPDLETQPGWRREGDAYFARFEDIRFQETMSDRHFNVRYTPSPGHVDNLNDYLRVAPAPRIIDVIVDDDTSVDVIVLVVCEAPAERAGTTVLLAPYGAATTHGALLIDCDAGGCAPLSGDTPCDDALPLLCFRDGDMPAPPWATDAADLWSGGEVALSTPVEASRFASAGEADAFCADAYGAGWRIASLHEGPGQGRFLALGPAEADGLRAWAHVSDQPYGACWAGERTPSGRGG